MRRLLIILIATIALQNTDAQEIFCNVQVNSQKIQGSNKQVFESMQSAIYEFMNNHQWTGYNVKLEERVECSILLTIDEQKSVDEFVGKFNIVLRRPVFNTAYNSTVLNYIDKDIFFTYIEGQPLDFAESTYTSELSSLLAFYSYIFLGIDFDTYSLYGGTPFFEKAQGVINSVPSQSPVGWKAFEDTKNRYWMVENFMNPTYQPLRKFLYEHHRKGLDIMSEKAAEGRANIAKNLVHIRDVYNERPGLFLVQLIMEAKQGEFISIFSEGTQTEKTNVVNIFKQVDPSNSAKYEEILKKGM